MFIVTAGTLAIVPQERDYSFVKERKSWIIISNSCSQNLIEYKMKIEIFNFKMFNINLQRLVLN